MSGGSYNYNYCTIREYYVGDMYDIELDEMMEDLVELLRDLEWWQSGDYSEEDYRETVRRFKAKWFYSDRCERLKPIIERKIEETRTELLNIIGAEDGDTK